MFILNRNAFVLIQLSHQNKTHDANDQFHLKTPRFDPPLTSVTALVLNMTEWNWIPAGKYWCPVCVFFFFYIQSDLGHERLWTSVLNNLWPLLITQLWLQSVCFRIRQTVSTSSPGHSPEWEGSVKHSLSFKPPIICLLTMDHLLLLVLPLMPVTISG